MISNQKDRTMQMTRSATRRRIKSLLRTALPLALAAALFAGCTVYEVAPGTYVPAPPTTFDRSWNAAAGAFEDQGVQITAEDRSTGTIRGRRGGIDLTAGVRTQADGSVRVEFNTAGATGQDPQLIERISRSYDRRMGR
jgi:hypothetical protein